ncbi:MAG: RluA family pseudouridine synthase [Desulfarculaceae bacterium]|nr:RluA family pseudouridine synthase [Desulfarculaceae bacterium]
MVFQFEVTHKEHGVRLDRLVSQKYQVISRSRAARLIQSGEIRADGKRVKPAHQVSVSESISGGIGETATDVVAAEQIELSILHEDESLIAVNKPPGLVVHPGAGNRTGTLVNALLHHCPSIHRAGKDMARSGIVHRLDKDTSGVLVAAKTQFALSFLQKEFRQRRVEKKYTALVSGVVAGESGTIRLPLKRHPVHRKMMAVDMEAGKFAETDWNVLERFEEATLLEVTLKTGRTHQIRAHFYAEGHPLVGETVYQTRKKRRSSKPGQRQMLHSTSLAFRHPFSGRKVRFSAPLCEDFRQKLETLRSNLRTAQSHAITG